MTLPVVNINELDGALGILPASSGAPMAIIAPSTSGDLDTPAAYAKPKSASATFGLGYLPEIAEDIIAQTGRAVLLVRCDADTDGAQGTLDDSGFAGSSTVTHDAAVKPADDYQVVVKFITGGTIGSAGITYQYSLDEGRTFSKTQALGTAAFITVANAFKFDFGAGTVVAGDVLTQPCTGPVCSSTNIADSLAALAATKQAWDGVIVATPVDGTKFDAVSSAISAMHAAGKHHYAVCGFRMPNSGESEATYKAAFDTAFGAKADTSVLVTAGADKQLSAVSARKYRRPFHFGVGRLCAKTSAEVSLASPLDAGNLKGIDIRDTNGNPDEHDEALNPGLDDSRACVARTFDSLEGVYVNRPRLLSPSGSDFVELQFRRVINIARTLLLGYFVLRLSKTVRVDKKTGFIREEEARAIESAVNALLRAALLTKPYASDVQFTLSRTDNILSTFTLTGTCRIEPLGYVEDYEIDVGFNNPALRVA